MAKRSLFASVILSLVCTAALASSEGSGSVQGYGPYLVKDGLVQVDSRYLAAKDEIFDYPVDSEVQAIVSGINLNQSRLEIVREIDRIVQDSFVPDNGIETGFSENFNSGKGDCDDYAILFVTISRAAGIPARPGFNSKHMWAEVLLPFEDGYRWVVVDPTGNYQDVSLSAEVE